MQQVGNIPKPTQSNYTSENKSEYARLMVFIYQIYTNAKLL